MDVAIIFLSFEAAIVKKNNDREMVEVDPELISSNFVEIFFAGPASF